MISLDDFLKLMGFIFPFLEFMKPQQQEDMVDNTTYPGMIGVLPDHRHQTIAETSQNAYLLKFIKKNHADDFLFNSEALKNQATSMMNTLGNFYLSTKYYGE